MDGVCLEDPEEVGKRRNAPSASTGVAEAVWREKKIHLQMGGPVAAFAAPSGTATEYVKEEIMSMTLMDDLGEERYWALCKIPRP
jgi:hypothetical protein